MRSTKIHSLWMENLVLIFPNQLVSDEQHIKFANQFGNLEVHPSLAHRSTRNKEIYRVSNVDESGNIIRAHDTAWQYINLSWLWHTDSSFRSVPSKVLYCTELKRQEKAETPYLLICIKLIVTLMQTQNDE